MAAALRGHHGAGLGLDLTAGGTFSIETDKLVVNGESCSTGQLVTGLNSSGYIIWAAPPTGPQVAAYSTTGGPQNFGGTIDVLTLDVPAGNYLMFGGIEIINRDDDTAPADTCQLGASILVVQVETGKNHRHAGSISGAVAHPGGPLALRCTESSPDADIIRSNFQGLRVGSLY